MESDSSESNDSNNGDRLPLPVPPTPSSVSVWDKARKALSTVSTHATAVSGTAVSKAAELGTASVARTADVIESGKQSYKGSMLESAINYLDGELDQRGAKKAIKDTSGAVVDKLDQVTGKRLVELLEAKLRVQDEYNDILATRLAEALERIARLEARFSNDN